MKQLLEYLVSNIVDQKEAIEISEKTDNGVKLLTLKVDASDMGKIIGKEGKVIKAIRTALKIRSFIVGERFHLLLEEAPHVEN